MEEGINTDSLMKRAMSTKHLKAFLKNNEKHMQTVSLTHCLKGLCEERGLVPERVILKSQLDRTYGHQIFNGTRHPSREKVLQLAFGMELNVEETQKLLRAAGRSLLYPRLKRDAILIYCLQNKVSLADTQELLAVYQILPLGEG